MSSKQKTTVKARGRPRLGARPSVQVAIRFPAEMIETIDEMAEIRLDKPDRAVLIRELLAEALEARRKRK